MVTLPSARRSATPEEMAYATMFGITPRLALLLANLAREPWVIALKTDICKLRSALEPESIDTLDGKYGLTEIGRHECQKARAEFAQWIRQGERGAA